MAAVAVSGKSLSSGHGCWPPRVCATGEGLHTINGNAVHCVGQPWPVHPDAVCGKHDPHGSVTVSGQPLHTINGKAVARVGSLQSCGDLVVSGESLHDL